MLVVVFGAIGIALNVGGVRDRFWVSPPLFDSIAVLPLDNTSGEADQAYLAGGDPRKAHDRAREARRILEGRRHRVHAPAQELERRRPPRSPIPRRAALVTGSVMRTGDRVQIDGAARRWHGWQGSLGSDLRTCRRRPRLASERRGHGDRAGGSTPAATGRIASGSSLAASVSPETYELYLRGMHELNSADDGGTPAAGIAYLQKAVDRDPGDPYAYAGMARGYVTQGHSPAASGDVWIRARAAAERALTLAPDLPRRTRRWRQVKLYLRVGLGRRRARVPTRQRAQPEPARRPLRLRLAYCSSLDRLDEAIVEHERARDIDPLTPRNTAYLSVLYTAARRFDDAIAAAKQVLEQYPRSGIAWEALAFAYS